MAAPFISLISNTIVGHGHGPCLQQPAGYRRIESDQHLRHRDQRHRGGNRQNAQLNRGGWKAKVVGTAVCRNDRDIILKIIDK